MMTSRRRSGVILLAVALVSLAPIAWAATTSMQVAFGDTVAGTIDTPGTDMLMASFTAAAGTEVRISARADDGSTVQPTIAVTDAGGTPVAGGATVVIEWLPVPNALYVATLPSDGTYVARIGASSGSGGFRASFEGAMPAGTTLSSISGRVTDGFTGAGLGGVTVQVGPFTFVTDANGDWGGQIPAGTYNVSVQAATYRPAAQSVTVGNSPASLPIALASATPVVLTAGVSGTADPGTALTGSVSAELRDGSTIESISWTQLHGVPVTITGATTEAPTITLPPMGAFKDALITHLSEPPIGPDQLPPNVPFPEGEFPGGLQDRFQVLAINPYAIEETSIVELEVEVVTTSGAFREHVEIHAEVPWAVNPGLRNVPIDVPVVLFGRDQPSYDWTMTGKPDGSTAALGDATGRAPMFTPDLPGLYTIEVSDLDTKGVVTLEVHAGTWRGVIVGQDGGGRPVADGSCRACHNAGFAGDQFSLWAQTGHAEIFTDLIDTSTYYREGCFNCHGVGYNPGADNEGWDDSGDYQSFLDAGLLRNPGDNWATMLDDYPQAARLANVQCENCHGPQSAAPGEEGGAHGWAGPDGEPRVSLSSDVCATCHGEPLRHARFQQWQLSAHANYELAVEEGGSGNCSRCHTVNGFLAWLPVLLDDDPETDPLANISVTWTEDEVHPQTCVACHDPHQIGTTSGNNSNANVYIEGDTPPLIAGFTATDAGRGAICMTCHNTRRGLRNDANFGELVGTSESVRAPHGGAQADVLMGQNAFFVEVGQRGGHSFLTDTCVTCHMEATDPPADLAYNLGGANHTFYASDQICAKCHEGLDGAQVQRGIQNILDQVRAMIEAQYLELFGAQIALGNTIDLNGAATISDVDDVESIFFTETRGRNAVTVTFTDGSSFGPYRLTDVDVVDAMSNATPIYVVTDEALLKAGWNYNLFANDGSFGVHNPSFAWSTLVATRLALAQSGKGALAPADFGPDSPPPGVAAGRSGAIKRSLDRRLDRRH